MYYNRFRYYDPESGNYISQDPIGLAGGNPTLYGYVPDTNSWVDVFGLELITVYRFDQRSPATIKANGGFTAKNPGANVDLYDYALNSTSSQYISTTYDLDSAINFGNDYYGGSGYLYQIQIDDSKGVNVNEVLGVRSPFKAEKEFAVIDRIPIESITGYVDANGLNNSNDIIRSSC